MEDHHAELLLLLTEFTIGKAGNWGFGLDSLSRNLTKAADKDASWSCKIWKISVIWYKLTELLNFEYKSSNFTEITIIDTDRL